MEERIKYLFGQYLNNTCTRKEFEEFFSYIRDAAHNETIRDLIKKVYDETGQTHSSLTYVDESGNLVLTEPEWYDPPTPKPRRRNKKIFAGMAIATAVGVLIAVAVWWQYKLVDTTTVRQAPIMTKKITERSEYKYLLLPDSTQVWLNAASSLEYPQQFGSDKREVFLSGEAYFDVKHADKVPFVIHTGKVSTLVLGTAFNIKAYPDRKNIIVSVSRGKVRVNYDNTEVATLTQGQQVKVSNIEKQVIEKKTTITEAAAWQQGNLVFEDETIEDIMAELERVYDVRIQVNNEAIRHEKTSTSFRREIGVEQALLVLCKLTDTQLKQAKGLYIIE